MYQKKRVEIQYIKLSDFNEWEWDFAYNPNMQARAMHLDEGAARW